MGSGEYQEDIRADYQGYSSSQGAVATDRSSLSILKSAAQNKLAKDKTNVVSTSKAFYAPFMNRCDEFV